MLNGADSNPPALEAAWRGGGGPHKSLHNGSFRKSINGRGERLHNRPRASLITYRVSSLASKVRGQPGFGIARNPLGCVGVCVCMWLKLSLPEPLGVFVDVDATLTLII